MTKKFLNYLIVLPMALYVLFTLPTFQEWIAADSVAFLMTAEQIAGIRNWPNVVDKSAFIWHPPLFIIVLSGIFKLFGNKLIFFRLFQLVTGLISICYIYLISKLCTDKKGYFVPLIACFIFSLSPLITKGSMLVHIDTILLTPLILFFIYLFLKNKDNLTIKNILKLSFVFALLLTTKLTTPPIILFVMLLYLLMNKKISQGIATVIIFILGFVFFGVFWILCGLKFNFPILLTFRSLIIQYSRYVTTSPVNFNIKSVFDIFRAILWFSPFFLFLWLLRIFDRIKYIAKNIKEDYNEEMLKILSIFIFIFYLFFMPLTHHFPKYMFPIFPIMGILVALIVAKEQSSIVYNLKIFFVFIGLTLIYNIIFVGDILYFVSYTIKETYIKNNFDVSVIYESSFDIIFKLLLSLVPALIIWLFYNRVKQQRIISSCILSLFIMFISSSLALNIVQFKAPYSVTFPYGNQGIKDLVKFLKPKITSDDKIIGPPEVIYYLDAVHSGFEMRPSMLDTPEIFLRLLNDINPAYVVYGIASNTIKQYRDIFNSELIINYFRDNNFKSKDIGSYTFWGKDL